MTGKETDFHVSDMRPFVFDSAVIDPTDIARRDHKILEHRGNLAWLFGRLQLVGAVCKSSRY